MNNPDRRTLRTCAPPRPAAEIRERQRRATMRKGAAAIGISLAETVVFGDCVLGLDGRGTLYRWMGGRWVKLEPETTGIRRAARIAAGAMTNLISREGQP